MAINTAWDHVNSNIFKTWVIMAFFSVFALGVIYVIIQALGYGDIGGLGIVGFALIFIGLVNLISYYYSDKIVLSVSGAKEVDEKSNKQLYRLVENLCIAGGLPKPKIYVIEDSATNAFATGRDPKHAAIAFTSGILEKLSKQELEGVAAHELSHVGNRDTLVMSITSVLVGTVALVTDMYLRSMWLGGERDNNRSPIFVILALVAVVTAPLVASLIQLAISRNREYLADAGGALITRNPDALAQALLKISGDREALEAANRGTAHMYIVNPLKGKEAVNFLASLFNTHPPIEDRVKRLREMGGRL